MRESIKIRMIGGMFWGELRLLEAKFPTSRNGALRADSTSVGSGVPFTGEFPGSAESAIYEVFRHYSLL